ncbi:hypothetical protein Golob_000941 [Gossypium lobatum]|uniref:Aminotransferase-like plant mobile domain-containing protein n=1 Tax=Gossypium lobatum TaxID=34289 RepID=A0A7J8N9R2_9ROSI|nr:hypothetical protein [Gossypium lobatum]
MKWLETNFKELPLNAPNLVKEQYARAFILGLIGGILMLDKISKFDTHKVLLHLVDFKECERLSWGSVVLAMLYWELCWATESNKMPIGGCLLLLWNHGPIYVGLPEHVKDIRLLLDQRLKVEFEWMSYADLDIIECIPLEFLAIRGMWDAKARSRQLHQKRPRRSLQQCRFRGGAATGSSPALTQQAPSMSMPHCS